MVWWIRPLVRVLTALALPLFVPLIISLALWTLPGDPAELLCANCGEATAHMAREWHLDQGPFQFFLHWLSQALTGDFGSSWSVRQGVSVREMLLEAIPATAMLVGFAWLPLALGTVLSARDLIPKKLDVVWQTLGVMPAVIMALFFAAQVEVNFGATTEGFPGMLRIMCGGFVLAFADNGFSGAVTGTRATFQEEMKQRYIGIAILRGESAVANALPNVLPALIGQMRSRVLQVLSGAVVVEIIMNISGLGDLLFMGTLKQDFAVVLAAAWAFSLLSSFLMLIQATAEVGVAMFIRRHPKGVALS